MITRALASVLSAACLLTLAACGVGRGERAAGTDSTRHGSSRHGPTTGAAGPTAGADRMSAWSMPVKLFGSEIRLAAGAKLHAVGVDGRRVAHRASADQGATWSDPVAVPGAGSLPLYGPLAADGTRVYLLTRSGGALHVQRSPDGGRTWSPPVGLPGYAADSRDRVQMDTEGGAVHVFVGRAGATPDDSFRVYYWRSTDAGRSFSDVAVLHDTGPHPASPGGIAVENGVVHIAYAAMTGHGTLGHRARYMRSTDHGTTWSRPVDVGGPGSNPQIRPRPRARDGRVLVIWEEPLDHDQARPYPNATRSEIRANVSPDGGATWEGPRTIAAVPGRYVNHPEVAVGPAGFVHVVYRVSLNQRMLTIADPMGYRRSPDHGVRWGAPEIAIDDPTRETHPYNLVATGSHVHVAAGDGVYARRPVR